jgi:hypothetical protein
MQTPKPSGRDPLRIVPNSLEPKWLLCFSLECPTNPQVLCKTPLCRFTQGVSLLLLHDHIWALHRCLSQLEVRELKTLNFSFPNSDTRDHDMGIAPSLSAPSTRDRRLGLSTSTSRNSRPRELECRTLALSPCETLRGDG